MRAERFLKAQKKEHTKHALIDIHSSFVTSASQDCDMSDGQMHNTYRLNTLQVYIHCRYALQKLDLELHSKLYWLLKLHHR